MRTKRFSLLIACALATNFLMAQDDVKINPADSTGLPGDQFSLQGALDLFKTSNSPEEFEKKLNSKDNFVNNLDLNGDGKIDYIRVVDNQKDNSHAIILQVPVNEKESQDVAVIEVEKTADQNAVVQIVGDKELYGDEKIVEPFEAKVKSTGKTGPSACMFAPAVVIVNVWFWPCVQFIYAPAYVVWVSPWRYQYYPEWWSPWEPYPWRYHYQHCYHYYSYYHPVYHHRAEAANQIYENHRTTSEYVGNRYRDQHTYYDAHRPQQKPARTANVQHQTSNPRINNGGNIHAQPARGQNAKPISRQPKPDNGNRVNHTNQRPAHNQNAKPERTQQKPREAGEKGGERNSSPKGEDKGRR